MALAFAVWRTGEGLVASGRSGTVCRESAMVQHRLFALWVDENRERFERLLVPGERVVGEWLALAHGTRYQLKHEPFVGFEIMQADVSDPDARERLGATGFAVPTAVHQGRPIPIAEVLRRLETSGHGALDPVEGGVWKVWMPDRSLVRAKFRTAGEAGRVLPSRGWRRAHLELAT